MYEIKPLPTPVIGEYYTMQHLK